MQKSGKATGSEFGRDWIVEEPRYPLETRHANNLRQDLDMPMEVILNRLPLPRSLAQERAVVNIQPEPAGLGLFADWGAGAMPR